MSSILNALGIHIIEVMEDKVVATMLVNDSTKQPQGQLYGGALIVLSETVACLGTWENINLEEEYTIALEINANYMKGIYEEGVVATAVPVHKGKKTMVWEIEIVEDSSEKVISRSRCTMSILALEKKFENEAVSTLTLED
ncbi:hotdog fold thioesterase [Geomicrobium sp. JCM 19038]|uniref:hotdog fold thioesterase n=1 Tax=Geomicrobium sp. JCM 19038 TaxID=1460635 RepID=UPI000694CC2A|nr:PaaI family thioesterase [Geomicrobium sp. JCM 19038]